MANDNANDLGLPQDQLIDGELDLLVAHLPELLKLLAEIEAEANVV